MEKRQVKAMKKYEIFYVKHIIKNKIFFFGFILLFIAVFLIGALSIKVSIVESYEAKLDKKSLYVEDRDLATVHINKLYIYQNRNEKVYQTGVQEIHARQDGVSIELEENFENKLEGNVSVDIVRGEQSLLKRIFVKAGKAE